MNKASILSVIRSILTAVGAYVAGKSFLGATIDNDLWLGIGGSIVTAVAVVWGIADKTATNEMVQSGLRSIVLTFGTLLVGSGVIKDEVLQSLLAIIAIVVPPVLSEANKRINKKVAAGQLGIADLDGVDIHKMDVKPKVVTPAKK